MNLRELNVDEMVTVTSELLDSGGDLWAVMQNDPLLEAFVQVLERAHSEIRTVQKTESTNQKRVQELTAEMTRLDAVHDRKARGVYTVLEGCADLADRPDEVERYRALVELLFPKGLSISQRNYRDQAGTAARVKECLSPVVLAQLDALNFGAHSLRVAVDDWLAAGQQIGRHEADRARLNTAESQDGVSAQQVREARIFWIQSVNAFLGMLPLSDLDAPAQRTLSANIEDASQKAQARREPRAEPADGNINPEMADALDVEVDVDINVAEGAEAEVTEAL